MYMKFQISAENRLNGNVILPNNLKKLNFCFRLMLKNEFDVKSINLYFFLLTSHSESVVLHTF